MKSRYSLVAASLLAFSTTTIAEEKISMAYLLGSSGAPPLVMQSQKLAEKYGIEIEYKPFQQVAALDRAFALGEVDVNANLALNQWAKFLNQGHDHIGVLGALHPVGVVIVPTKSEIKSLKDLVGKRIGVYGLHGTSTAILGVLVNEALPGTDIRKSMQLFGSVPPILPSLIAKGDVDAILNVPPFVPKMVHSGDYRVLVNTNDFWVEQTGRALPFAVIAVTRETLRAKPKAIRGLVNAWRDAVDAIRRDPNLLNGYLEKARLTTLGEQKAAQQMMIPNYMNTWTPEDIRSIRLYWERALKANFLDSMVTSDNWYTFDFAK